MHKALHPKNDINRLYVMRKEGGNAITSIVNCVDAAIQGLGKYKGEQKMIDWLNN